MDVYLEKVVPMVKPTVTAKLGPTIISTAGSNQLGNSQLASYLFNQQDRQQLGQLVFPLNYVFNQD
eukprot:5934148-Ditylum_brightwellii.AAC.1